MKVSIITPYYNGAKYIEDAVNSVLAQGYDNFEMIIVNDASPDKPYSLLENLQKRDDRIKVYHHEENKGIAAARNTAIRNSSGECFALLDQDDMWLPEKLQLQVEQFEMSPDVGLLFSNYIRIDELGNIMGQGGKCKKIVAETMNGTLINIFQKNRITACSVAFRKECIDTIGLFDEQIKGGKDDCEMWLRIAGRYKFKYIDLPLVKRRSHGQNTSNRFKEKGLLDHLTIAGKICNLYPVLNKYKAQRLATIYYNLGRHYSKSGNKIVARTYFTKMKEQTPFNLKPYLAIIKSFF